MFVGRERELATLNRLYASDKFEFAVLYGRRRVGKTTLLREFIRDKSAIYFMAVENNIPQNLEAFSRCVLRSDESAPQAAFPDFSALLRHVFARARDRRLILVIDEYPYLAQADRSFASTLQKIIDAMREQSRLMLILCGSSMSYMRDEVLAYKAPLYGRRTAQIRLEPMSFADSRGFTAGFAPLDQALIYGIAGGTPQYLKVFDPNLSLEDNLRRNLLSPDAMLFEEPESLLRQEFRQAGQYAAIMHAIAGGASRLAEISGKTGMENSACSVYLNNLTEVGLVQRELPFGDKLSRRSIYRIADNLFRFWYRFVYPNRSVLELGADVPVLARIMGQLGDHMGQVFEDICTQYLWSLLLADRAPVFFRDLGRWWGTDPVERCQSEIDIMGDDGDDAAVFAECKWTSEKVDAGVLKLLQHRSAMFRHSRKHLFVFAKSGFTDECRKAAEEARNVNLVTYGEILRQSQR